MLLRVEFSFFFGDSYSKKSSDANLSYELDNLWTIISVMFSFSFSILAISRLITYELYYYAMRFKKAATFISLSLKYLPKKLFMMETNRESIILFLQ